MNALLLYAFRRLARRPARTALTFLGVVLGVAALTAIGIATRSARNAYHEMFASLTGRAGLEVVAEGGGGFDPAVRSQVAAVRGVRAAVPVVLRPTAITAPGPHTPIVLLGIDLAQDGAVRDLELNEGRLPAGVDEVVVLESFARSRGLAVGGHLRLVTPSGLSDLRVVGLAGNRALAVFPGGVVLTSLATAQGLFRLGDRITAVQLVAEDEADPDAVERGVRSTLTTGLRVQAPAARGRIAQASLRSADQGLEAVSLMALVAAVFVIWNAFAMDLAERRRALATLRALGATRGQVARALVAEASILGGVGTGVGVLVGIAASRLLGLGIGRMLGVELPAADAGFAPIAVALVAGPVTTIGAALFPARRAARRHPLPDLLGVPEPAGEALRLRIGLVGLAALLVALASMAGFVTGVLPSGFIAPAVAVTMLGAALSFPLALPAIRRGVHAALAPLVGPAGRIGLRHVATHGGPTAMSSTVLFVAAMAGVGMGNEILSSVRDVHDWADTVMFEDYFVRATMPESGTVFTAPVAESVGLEIAAMPDVDRLHRIRFLLAEVAGAPVVVMARTFDEGRPVTLDLVATQGGGPPGALRLDETVVGTALAQRLHAKPGDTLEIATPKGPRRLRIVATATEYTAGGQALYVSTEAAADLFGASAPDAYMVIAKEGRRAALGEAIAALCARDGLLFQSSGDMKVLIDEMVGGLVGLLWTALAVVFLVASLGVVNALTTNVLEQTREIGVLRAVAMTRGQVARMVLAEAIAMAVAGIVPGAFGGIGLSRLMNAAMEPLRGFPIEFHVAGGLVVGCVGIGLGVAVASALAPAIRAARLPVPLALREE